MRVLRRDAEPVRPSWLGMGLTALLVVCSPLGPDAPDPGPSALRRSRRNVLSARRHLSRPRSRTSPLCPRTSAIGAKLGAHATLTRQTEVARRSFLELIDFWRETDDRKDVIPGLLCAAD